MTDHATKTSPSPRSIVLVRDECAELFGGDRQSSAEFERAVADALALLDQNANRSADER